MYEDMAESVNEEVPLAHQKREALPSVVSQGGASCRHFSLTASRSATSTTGQRVSSPAACASASIRQLVLPWATPAAAAGVLLTGQLSATDIVLNLLAVAFIFEVERIAPSSCSSRIDKPSTPECCGLSLGGQHARCPDHSEE